MAYSDNYLSRVWSYPLKVFDFLADNSNDLKNNSEVLMSLVVSLGGCATMFTDAERRLIIRSDNPQAKLYLNSRYLGKQSANAKIRPYKSYVISAKKAGCQTYTQPVDKKMYLGWFLLGNCLLNSCLGIPIDLITGAWIGLDQQNYIINPTCG